jgi:hypothetical protein
MKPTKRSKLCTATIRTSCADSSTGLVTTPLPFLRLGRTDGPAFLRWTLISRLMASKPSLWHLSSPPSATAVDFQCFRSPK